MGRAAGFSNRDIQSAIVRVSNPGQSGKLDGGFLLPPVQNQQSSQANLRQIMGPQTATRNQSKEQSQSGLVNRSTKLSESNALRGLTSGDGAGRSSASAYGISSFHRSNKAAGGLQSSSQTDMFGQQISVGKSQTNMQAAPKSAILRNGQAKGTDLMG